METMISRMTASSLTTRIRAADSESDIGSCLLASSGEFLNGWADFVGGFHPEVMAIEKVQRGFALHARDAACGAASYFGNHKKDAGLSGRANRGARACLLHVCRAESGPLATR